MVYSNVHSYFFDESLSPYAHVLHTNYVPSHSELQELNAFLSEPESELRRLETEITRMRTILDGLVLKHDKLKSFVDAHKVLVSQFRRLPPEVLEEIFVRCLSTTRNSVMHRSEAPMLLTEICRDWRRIALSTPTLWASLHFVYPGPALIVERFDLAKAWLARSGALPLSISIYHETETPLEYSLPLTELLGPLLHRCKRLHLEAPNVLPHIEQMNLTPLPLLEDIRLHTPRRNNDLGPDSLSFLKDVSSLRRVHLTGIREPEPLFLLPFGGLEELELHSRAIFHPTDLSRMLKQCRNLRSLSLSMRDIPMSLASLYNGERITLPRLQVIHIRSGDDMLQWIFENIILPQVHDLSIERSYLSETNPSRRVQLHTLMSSILTQSSCTLQTLRLQPFQALQSDLIACLSLIPSITDLQIDNGVENLDDSFVRLLTRTGDSSSDAACLCPNLQRITLHYCSSISLDTLVDFIRSRWHSISPNTARLVYADITFTTYMDSSTAMSQLSTFRDEGLDVTVELPPKSSLWPSPPGPWKGLP